MHSPALSLASSCPIGSYVPAYVCGTGACVLTRLHVSKGICQCVLPIILDIIRTISTFECEMNIFIVNSTVGFKYKNAMMASVSVDRMTTSSFTNNERCAAAR